VPDETRNQIPPALLRLRAALGIARFLLGMPLLVAVAGGSAAWAFAHPALLAALSENDVAPPVRLVGILCVVAAFFAVAALYGIAALGMRRREGAWPTREKLARIHGWFGAAIAAPFGAALLTPKIERHAPITTSILILCAATLCVPTLKKAFELRAAAPGAAPRPPSRLLRIAPWAIAAALAVGYALFITRLSFNNFHTLKTRTWDLAIYVNVLFQSSHGNPMGCSILEGGYHNSAHFDPILLVLSLFYWLYPKPEFLLVVQSAWCALGALPAFLLGRHHLRSAWAGLAMAVAWLANPALHGANLIDFHSLTLVATPLLFALYFLETDKPKRFLAVLPVLLLIREDVSVVMAVTGLAVAIAKERRNVRLGLLTICVSAVYVAIAKLVFMNGSGVFNDGEGSYGYAYYYRFMMPHKGGLPEYLGTLATNPVHAILSALDMHKIDFIFKMLGPLLFLPLLAPRWRIMLIYGVVAILLSSRESMFSTHYQYPMPVLPVLFALAPAALHRLETRGWLIWAPLGRATALAVACAIAIASLLAGMEFGALAPNASFYDIPRALSADQRAKHAAVERMAASIPEGASVQSTLSLCAFAANRRTLYVQAFLKPLDTVDYYFVEAADFDRKKKYEKLRDEIQALLRARKIREIDSFDTVHLYERMKRAPPEPLRITAPAMLRGPRSRRRGSSTTRRRPASATPRGCRTTRRPSDPA
jgi:uncharacterized membrane protein